MVRPTRLPSAKSRRGIARTQLHLRPPVTLVEQIAAAAQDAGVSVNHYCEIALTVYLRFLATEGELHESHTQHRG